MKLSREAKPAAIMRTIETVAPFFSVPAAVTTRAWCITHVATTNADARHPKAINAGSRTRKTGIAGN